MFEAENFHYKYSPILSLRPSEINALEELTEKDKGLIFPIILLRGWVASKKLENSIPRIQKAFGEQRFALDIDASFLDETKKIAGEYTRDVFREIQALLSPTDGYNNWFEYLTRIAQAVPVLQLGDISQLDSQVDKLASLNRGLVVKFDITTMLHAQTVFRSLSAKNVQDLFIVFDYGQVDRDILTRAAAIIGGIQQAHTTLPTALFAISCSSFPSAFSPYNNGENSIYERMLFNQVHNQLPTMRMLYSDRGSVRSERAGGGGIPSPRIDYPLKNQWRFVRKEYADPKKPEEDEKIELYTEVAQEVMNADYWISGLHVWGTQMIELTSKGDGAGIDSPTKATAVRINLHMHQQVCYDETDATLLDTEEDWID